MRHLIRFIVVLGSLGQAGCASDCQSLCKEWIEEDCCDKNELECADTEPEDCEFICAQQERLAEKAGCEEELDAYNECEASLEDICDSSSTCTGTCDELGGNCEYECSGGECDSEIEQFSECTYEHCSENTDDPACY